MSYGSLKKVALSSLLIFSFLSWYLHVVARQENVYPFFTWNLFSYIPNRDDTFVLEILSYDNKVYGPPFTSDQNLFLFKQVGETPTYYARIIDGFGRALTRGDGSAAQYRGRLEKIFLGRPATYRITEITYDPVEYWRDGTYETKNVAGIFTAQTTP